MNNQPVSIPATGITPDSATTLCHNLRPGEDSVLTPVAPPFTLVEALWRPIAEIRLPSGDNILVITDDVRIATFADGNIEPIATIGSPVLCAVSFGLRLSVMTTSGLKEWMLDAQTRAWTSLSSDALPEISLVADQAADCEFEIANRQLSAAYTSPAQTLRDDDRRMVTSDLKLACACLARRAAAQGAYCAPTLMRYRLVDSSGAVVFVSPPLLLGPADSPVTDPITVTSPDRRNLNSFKVSAAAWRPRLVCNAPSDSEAARSVSRLELLACPQFHHFHPLETPEIDLVIDPGSDDILRLTLPGTDRSLSVADSRTSASRVARMVAQMDRYERVVATVERPFDGDSGLDVTLRCLWPFGLIGNECRLVDTICSAAVEPCDESAVSLSPPHSFSARCVASVADTVVWGGLEAERFRGYAPQVFAASRGGTGPWHAAVAVTFASGREQVVAAGEGNSGAPLTFNPLLSYPSPDAVAMTLIVSSGGEVRRTSLPLTPDPSRRMAVYVDPSFAPFAPEEKTPAFVVPTERRFGRPLDGFVASADIRSPASVKGIAYVGDGRVDGLLPASRSQSSWDFMRPRFSAFSSSGIHTLTLSPSGGVISVSLIDSRRPSAAIMAADRVLAVADGCLVEVGAAKTKTLLDDLPADFLAFDSRRSELWAAARGGGTSTVVCLKNLSRYTRDDLLMSQGLGRYVLVGGSLCDLASDAPFQSVYVRWAARASLGRGYRRLRALSFDLRSSSVSYGNLQLSRTSLGAVDPSPSLRIALDGRIGSPVVAPVVSAPMRSVSVSFQGRLSPDSVISSVNLHLSTL